MIFNISFGFRFFLCSVVRIVVESVFAVVLVVNLEMWLFIEKIENISTPFSVPCFLAWLFVVHCCSQRDESSLMAELVSPIPVACFHNKIFVVVVVSSVWPVII